MSKYIQPWYPSLFFAACRTTEPVSQAQTCSVWISKTRRTSASVSKIAESQWSTGSPSSAGLRVQSVHTQQALETTCTSLQQDLRTLRTACLCIHSLRIRVEARANIAERAVIDQQIQFVRTTVQPYPTEDLRTANTSCLSRTSFTSANSSWWRSSTLANLS